MALIEDDSPKHVRRLIFEQPIKTGQDAIEINVAEVL